MKSLLTALAALLLALPASAQETSDEECGGLLDPSAMMAAASAGAAQPAEAATEAGVLTDSERRVQEIVARDGVHVVHFWAPWCDNSVSELRNGWYELVEKNGDVSFTFVTVWNDGASGLSTMERFAIPERVVELTQPDPGPSSDKTARRTAFLGLPMTWIPSTWIFHHNGELAFALNYGEMSMEALQSLIDAARTEW